MKHLLIFSILLLFAFVSEAQPSTSIAWDRAQGGTNSDEANCIQLTNDGGYIVAGFTASNDGNVTYSHGMEDYWIYKLNSAGEMLWQHTYGGSGIDIARYIVQTPDGGYIITGSTGSSDGDVTNYHQGTDIWVVRTDAQGTLLWQKCYGTAGYESGADIQCTSDGGYILCGTRISGDFQDILVIKMDASGNVQWQNFLGGPSGEEGCSVRQTSDGYLVAGNTSSASGGVTGFHGETDFWVVKINNTGNTVWQKCYGGSLIDALHEMQLTPDGGFILAGSSASSDGDVTGNHGHSDYWIVKANSAGTIQWAKSYGGTGYDDALSVKNTLDGGYVFAGNTQSDDWNVTGNNGLTDAWVLKINASGGIEWEESFGTINDDWARSIIQATASSYVFAGTKYANAIDCWVLRTCSGDPVNISISDSTFCESTYLTATEGFASYAWSTGDTTRTIQVFQGGHYYLTATNLAGCPSQSMFLVPEPGYYSGDPIDFQVTVTEYCDFTTLIADTGFVSYQWSTGDTARSITVSQGGNYWVTGFTADGCNTSASHIVPGPIGPYQGQEICLASVDTLSGKIFLVIEPAMNQGIDSLYIYRSPDQGSTIERVAAMQGSASLVWKDEVADPGTGEYRYSISILDTLCRRESNRSPVHHPIHLNCSLSPNKEVILYWSAYEGFTPATVQLFRRSPGLPFVHIADIPSSTLSYTDVHAPLGENTYFLKAEKGTSCTAGGLEYSSSFSNFVLVNTIGIEERTAATISVVPNPADRELHIEVPPSLLNESYTIFDPVGRVAAEGYFEALSNVLDISGLHPGMYVLWVKGYAVAVKILVK